MTPALDPQMGTMSLESRIPFLSFLFETHATLVRCSIEYRSRIIARPIAEAVTLTSESRLQDAVPTE